MKKSFIVAILGTVLMMLSMTSLYFAKTAGLTGQWLVVYEGNLKQYC